MRILWIDPIGSDAFRDETLAVLNDAKRPTTRVEFVSLPPDRPQHLEARANEARVLPDVVRITREAAAAYDGIVIGCFFDTGLREARAVAGAAVVAAPCQATTRAAVRLGKRFSILVGRAAWIPRVRENLRAYGVEEQLASIRELGLGVHDLAADAEAALERMKEAGRRAIEADGAEALIVGCTADTRSSRRLQDELGVPVLDPVVVPFRHAEGAR